MTGKIIASWDADCGTETFGILRRLLECTDTPYLNVVVRNTGSVFLIGSDDWIDQKQALEIVDQEIRNTSPPARKELSCNP